MIVLCSRRRPRRRAITLVEILLVLCLLLIIASMAWPVLDKTFDAQRLRKAADQVRAEWARARVKALSTGRIHIFQYAVGADRYATHRRVSSQVDAGGAARDVPPGFTQASYHNPTPFGGERKLPEGVRFVASETIVDSRAEMVAADADSFRSADLGWSEPIFFYPDGTTSTARLVLKNRRGRTIELALRGLTGVVTVGDVQTPQEMLP